MKIKEFIDIERRVLSRDFYMNDFLNNTEAAKYLNISTADFLKIMTEYNTNLFDFVNTMRIEDAKDSLTVEPLLTNEQLAVIHKFKSEENFLSNFYIIEKCSPNEWMLRNGII